MASDKWQREPVQGDDITPIAAYSHVIIAGQRTFSESSRSWPKGRRCRTGNWSSSTALASDTQSRGCGRFDPVYGLSPSPKS